MDFELPEDIRLLRETVRKFVDRELIPIEMHSMDGPELKPEYKKSLEAKARELGLWQLDTPAEFGGQGLSLLALAVVWEEVQPLDRAAKSRRRCVRAVAAPDPAATAGEDEGEVPLSAFCAARSLRPSRRPSRRPAAIPAA